MFGSVAKADTEIAALICRNLLTMGRKDNTEVTAFLVNMTGRWCAGRPSLDQLRTESASLIAGGALNMSGLGTKLDAEEPGTADLRVLIEEEHAHRHRLSWPTSALLIIAVSGVLWLVTVWLVRH